MLALRRASPTAVVLGERLIGPRGEPAGAPSSSQATYPQGSDTRHTAFDLPPYRTSKTMEIIMAVVRCDDYSPYGMTCPQCNDLMIAPRSSAYVSCNSALHCWSCDTCGHDAEIFDRFVRLSCCRDCILAISNLGCSSTGRQVTSARRLAVRRQQRVSLAGTRTRSVRR